MKTEADNENKRSLKAKLVIGLIKLLASLPLGMARTLLRPLAWLQMLISNENKRVSKVNIETCLSQLEPKVRHNILNSSLRSSTDLISETAHIWLHNYKYNRSLITSVKGMEVFREAQKDTVGNLVISPHLGNWELLYAYLGFEFNASGLYKPPNIPELEPIMLAGRQEGGEIIRTSTMEVRKMLRVIKKGQSLFLLPDQQPPDGSGVFAPFFGQPAYTMTLLQGLLKRTKAKLWIAHCLRIEKGFELDINPLELDYNSEPEAFASQLNQALETVILKAPEQYQWAYKRFKKTPDNSLSIYQR